ARPAAPALLLLRAEHSRHSLVPRAGLRAADSEPVGVGSAPVAAVVHARHGLRAALTPIVTQFGIDLGTLLGGAIITETVFGLPGVGFQAVRAITANDLPIIIGVVV